MEKEERAVLCGSWDGGDSLDIPEGLGGSCLTQWGLKSPLPWWGLQPPWASLK